MKKKKSAISFYAFVFVKTFKTLGLCVVAQCKHVSHEIDGY